MAQIVSIIGITHNPFMPRLFTQPQQPPGAAVVQEKLAQMREQFRRAEPEVVVGVGNDHLNQFFMDNMPPFLVGKMDRFDGTFYNEVREFGLPVCQVPGDPEMSECILEGGLDRGIDFSYSNEVRLDHSIIVPMLWLRPEMDLPVAPILTNCIAPPLPRARRFFEVGKAIRGAIEDMPGNKRVAVVVSGHLSLEVGGPRQFERKLTDPNFDQQAVGWIANGDIDAAASYCQYPVMQRSGNMTHGFLNFLLAMGVADRERPTHAEGLDAGFPAIPFFLWEPAKEAVA